MCFPCAVNHRFQAGWQRYVVQLGSQFVAIGEGPVEEFQYFYCICGFFCRLVNQNEGCASDGPAILARFVGQDFIEALAGIPFGVGSGSLEAGIVRFDVLAVAGIGLETVDGLIYRRDGSFVKNKKRSFIEDLDSIPFPARELLDMTPYMHGSMIKRLYGLGGKPAMSILTSRSCPNRCSYCNMWLVHGSRWRGRSADNIISEIDEIVNRYKAEHLFIVDDNFTFKPDRTKIICERIIQKDYRIRWNTPNGISVKRVDDEMAALMKRAGCANVCVAIESGSEYIRNVVMNKKISNDEIEHAVSCFSRAGIPVVGFVLIGMPGEDAGRFDETMKFVRKLPLASIVVSYAIPFPGTKLHDDLIADCGIEIIHA